MGKVEHYNPLSAFLSVKEINRVLQRESKEVLLALTLGVRKEQVGITGKENGRYAKAHFRGNSLVMNALYVHLCTDPNLRIRMVLQFIIVEGGLIL